MAVDGVNKWTSSRKVEGFPRGSADAGRDGRTRLARLNSQAQTGTRKTHFSCSTDHGQDWQPYQVDPYYTLLLMMTIHTYIIRGTVALHTFFTLIHTFFSALLLLLLAAVAVRFTML